MSKHKKLVLVDGSSYLYRAFHALPPLTTPDGYPTGMTYGVIKMLRALIEQEQPDNFAVIFDAKGKTFRHDLYSQYKAHRPPMPTELAVQIPKLFELIKLLGYPLVQVMGVEADDVIGTLAQQATKQAYQVVISTGDKDLMQLVGNGVSLYDSMKKQYYDDEGVKKKMGVAPNQIIDYLALMGDKSDNIPGVNGVGPKTASKWLGEYGSLDNLIAHCEELTGKVSKNLQEAIPELPLLKKLVTIDKNLELGIVIENLQNSTPDKEALAEEYQELGFKQLLQELGHEGTEGTQPTTETSIPIKPLVTEHSYQLILDQTTLKRWLKKLSQEKYFIVRLETDDSNYVKANIIGMAFATENEDAAYVPVAHDYTGVPAQITLDGLLKLVQPLLADHNVKKAGHDLKYVRNVLAKYKIVLRGMVDDSMLASYIYNSSATPHHIENLAQRYLGESPVSYGKLVGKVKGRKKRPFSKVALKNACAYSCTAATTGNRLQHFLRQQFLSQDRWKSVYQQIEMPLLLVLSDMEQKGVLIAAADLQQQSKELAERIADFSQQAHEVAGKPFNLDSPTQIRDILFRDMGLPTVKKTPKGEASTAEDVLQSMAYSHELPRIILEYRGLRKLQTTYTDKLPSMQDPNTQRIHTSYNQTGTTTGRLSSSDPNLQNIPIRSAAGRRIRQAFIAEEGYCLLAADYSQIELRIMAHFSEDKRLCAAFEEGLDIHATTASEVLGIPLAEVNQEQRRLAKAINFGLIYSISAFGLARQLKIDRNSAQQYMKIYFDRYPGIKEYMSDIKQVAERQGYVETLLGRRIYFPDIKVPRLKMHAQRAAINAPMQGTAADIIKQAMINLHQSLQEMKVSAAIVMQVHDELVLEVAKQDLDKVSQQCNSIMSSVINLRVPLVVDIGTGNNWDQAH